MIVQMMCMPISLKCGLANWGQDDVDVAASVELNGTCGSTEAILGGLSRGRQLAPLRRTDHGREGRIIGLERTRLQWARTGPIGI
jgi:hypothetical protein